MNKSPGNLFDEAYNVHYVLDDPDTAFNLYEEIISAFPKSAEASYAKSQIQNIELTVQASGDPPAQNEAKDRSKIVVTTAPSIDGFHVTQTLEVVTAECVFGMNIFRDMFAGVRDVVGGRSVATQKILRDARVTCLTELKREAENLGANAVIATRLDYSEFSGGGKSMLFLVASGTAVVIKSEQTEELEVESDEE